MFENRTYERMLEDVLASAPEGIDTRQGSIFYDAISGILLEIAKLYTDLDLIFKLVFIDTTSGEYLDMRASEYGIYRLAATPCRYEFVHEGTLPQTGERFFYDGMYFTLCAARDGSRYLEAEESGIHANYIVEGTPASPVNSIQGLTAASFGAILESGTEMEGDDDLRSRIRERISGPAENGNRQHYKTWCESIDGIGRARIFPLWNGPNTIKAVLISSNGTPCSTTIVERVQRYIDPDDLETTITTNGKTYNVGDGLGEGVANLGAHFTAVSAEPLTIDVSFVAEINESTIQTAKEETEAALTEYLKQISLDDSTTRPVVRASAIGAIISQIPSIIDYSELTVNGENRNITPTEDQIPILGQVTIDVE